MIDCWVSNKNTKVKLSNCWEDILVKKWVSWGTGRVKLNTRVRIWYMKERSLQTNYVQIIYYNRSKSTMAIILILTLSISMNLHTWILVFLEVDPYLLSMFGTGGDIRNLNRPILQSMVWICSKGLR